jgi:hypothetical protein
MTLILAELEWLALQLVYRSHVYLNQLGPFKRVGQLNSFGRRPSIRCRLRAIKYRIIRDRSPTLFVSELKKSSLFAGACKYYQFAAGLEILKIYEPRSRIGCEK